jgi:hypothetical protein
VASWIPLAAIAIIRSAIAPTDPIQFIYGYCIAAQLAAGTGDNVETRHSTAAAHDSTEDRTRDSRQAHDDGETSTAAHDHAATSPRRRTWWIRDYGDR